MRKLPTSPPPSEFPSDVLKWMKKSATPKLAFRLMFVCKYFQHQEFPYLIVEGLRGEDDQWNYLPLLDDTIAFVYEYIDLETTTKKLWITRGLDLTCNDNWAITLLPKIAVCDIRELNLCYQNITFEELKVLTASKTLTKLNLSNAFIKDENSENVPLEDILEAIPEIESVGIRINGNAFVTHQNAIEKVSTNLNNLNVWEIDDKDFKFEECFKFIQRKQEIQFSFQCDDSNFSDEIRQKLQLLTDNLFERWETRNPPPHISFQSQTAESKDKLEELWKLYHEKNNFH
uniref:Uncharacterized protein n=1 Tax=Panagrolaimus superbus TaxID=310955 RepID=A0A914YVP0_9BILA